MEVMEVISVYRIRQGTVLVGRLMCDIASNDEVMVGGKKVRVFTLEKYGKSFDKATGGDAVGLLFHYSFNEDLEEVTEGYLVTKHGPSSG